MGHTPVRFGLFIFCLLLLHSVAESQTVKLIGNEPSDQFPFGRNNFHVSQHCYTHTELAGLSAPGATTINYLAFQLHGSIASGGQLHNVFIYLKNSSASSFDNTQPSNFEGYSLVFNGDVYYDDDGNLPINLPVNFTYQNVNGNHLHMMVVRMFGPKNPDITIDNVYTAPSGSNYASCFFNHSNLPLQSESVTLQYSPLKPAINIGYIAPPAAAATVSLDLKFLLAERIKSGATMRPFLYEMGYPFSNTLCDFVTVELRSPSASNQVEASYVGLVHTDGTMSCTFPKTLEGNSYYIYINHRHSLPVYSAQPVLFSNQTTYNFIDQAQKAYGNNVTALAPGTWALYGGNYNSNLAIDWNDWLILVGTLYIRWQIKKRIEKIINFYFPPTPVPPPADIPGDGSVDQFDYKLLDPSINTTIIVQHP